jgi:hypothetical protein
MIKKEVIDSKLTILLFKKNDHDNMEKKPL